MNRITKKEPDGTWNVLGIPWKEMDNRIYGALCKLKDYEDTGFDPKEIETMKELLRGKCYACKNAKEYKLAPNSRNLKTCDFMTSCASTGIENCKHWELLKN